MSSKVYESSVSPRNSCMILTAGPLSRFTALEAAQNEVTPEDLWRGTKTVLLDVARETSGSVKSQKKKKWISDETYAAIREKWWPAPPPPSRCRCQSFTVSHLHATETLSRRRQSYILKPSQSYKQRRQRLSMCNVYYVCGLS